MKFVADENIDRQIIDLLRQDGHQILCVAEMDPGTSDDEVLEIANRDSAPLLTSDRDFGELVFRQRRITSGVILIRLAGLSAQRKAEVVSTAIMQHDKELQNAFAVIRPGAIRIRKNLK
jgi:predicted nuclease of predicted toxin-antitoxin system